MLRALIAGAVVLTAVLFANPAGALSLYGELLTSQAVVTLPSDARARDSVELNGGPLLFDWSGGIVENAGLGSGDVPPDLTFTHYFAPADAVAEFVGASLFIAVRDDFDLQLERALIQIDGSLWRQGQATLNLFGGEVTGFLVDDQLTVTVSSAAVKGWFSPSYTGDFKVVKSLFVAAYEPAAATPEPGAALLFGIGLLLVQRRLRRR